MFPFERLFRPLTWACVVLLAVLSLSPGEYIVRTGAPGDFEHFVAYLGTGFIASLGYARRFGCLVPAVLLCGYAGVLETEQNWASGHHPDFVDFACSSAGGKAGILLAWAWEHVSSFICPRTKM